MKSQQSVSLKGSKTLINLSRITRKANQTEFGLFMQLQIEKAQTEKKKNLDSFPSTWFKNVFF